MNTIENILAKHFVSESLTQEEQKILEVWIKDNPKEYEDIKKFMSWEHEASDSHWEINVEKAYQKIKNRISGTKQVTKIPLFRWVGIAACVIAVISIAFNYLYNPIYEISSGDHIKTIAMIDGSAITLNKNSSIKYKKQFVKNRTVTLKGQAFFEVSRDTVHPFVITTDNAIVKVLGTSFDVNAPENFTMVNVKTGKVELQTQTQKVELLPGEQGVYVSGNSSISKNKSRSQNYMSWKNSKLVFDKTDFRIVLRDMSNYYDANIVLQQPVDGKCLITTTFTTESLDDAMKELQMLLHFDYTIHGKDVVISNLKCEN